MTTHTLWRFAALCLLLAPVPVAAQTSTTINVARGLETEQPYSIFFPAPLAAIEDGSETTAITIQHPQAPLQCDTLIGAYAPANWDPEAAAQQLDKPAIEASWVESFPGFTVTSQGITSFQSGPALLYEGDSTSSPMGLPMHVIHAEAVDGGRTYIIECLLGRDIAAEARPLIDFVIANFSTRADAECCVQPKEPQ